MKSLEQQMYEKYRGSIKSMKLPLWSYLTVEEQDAWHEVLVCVLKNLDYEVAE